MTESLKLESGLEDYRQFYIEACRAIGVEQKNIELTVAENKAKKLIPVRNQDLKAPLGRDYLRNKLESTGINMNLPISKVDRRITYEILNFIDGKNSILDIRNAVSAEFGPVPVDCTDKYRCSGSAYRSGPSLRRRGQNASARR